MAPLRRLVTSKESSNSCQKTTVVGVFLDNIARTVGLIFYGIFFVIVLILMVAFIPVGIVVWAFDRIYKRNL